MADSGFAFEAITPLGVYNLGKTIFTGKAQGAVGRAAVTAVQKVLGIIPQLEDEVTVEVVGQPDHNKQQLYFLALAAANGVVRRRFTLANVAQSFGALIIEYDAADHWVRCTIRYRQGTTRSNCVPDGGFEVGTKAFFDSLAIYRGPQCNVNGGTFDFVSGDVPGIPASSTDPNQAPQLPFAGSPILTPCPTTPQPSPDPITQYAAPSYPLKQGLPTIPSPNPKPPGDNRSRGEVKAPGSSGIPGELPGSCCDRLLLLMPLVYAALSSPGTNADMTFPAPTSGPTGG